jgi:hypothetical protein
MKISKTTTNRLIREIPKYQAILEKAKNRDVNESDTVIILTDVLTNIFGFDKFNEITSEQAIRGTYCDLAIKIDDKVKYLIEVKAVGIALKDIHLNQAVNYGANSGVQWVILTNGIIWEIHKININQSVSHELVCYFDFLNLNPKKQEDLEKVYLLCKEGTVLSAIDEHYSKYKLVNKFMIGAICLQPPVLGTIRKELKRVSPQIKVTDDEIKNILSTEIIKREILEEDSFNSASKKVRRIAKKAEAKATQQISTQEIQSTETTQQKTDTQGG